ncbi:MAG: hypothetical protein MK212_11680 [Saprospiraceae bacterium]|nr:hypothetical protein [Saprospiraceae bacterium]
MAKSKKEIIANSKKIKVEENGDQLTLIYLSGNRGHIIYAFILIMGTLGLAVNIPSSAVSILMFLVPIDLLLYYWIYKVMTSNTLIVIDKKIGYLSKKNSYRARTELSRWTQLIYS